MKQSFFLSFIPLIFFISGYSIISFFFNEKSIQVPALLGHSVYYALKRSSQDGFYLTILSEKEAADIPQGTVLEQRPVAGASIKPRQAVFITVSAEPAPSYVPDMRGLYVDDQLVRKQVHTNLSYCLHNAPVGMIVAQWPEPDTLYQPEDMITLLVSSGPETKRIMPSVCGQDSDKVKHTLEEYRMSVIIYRQRSDKRQSKLKKNNLQPLNTVMQQMPLAGSWIDIKKPLTVRLVVLGDEPSY